MLTIAVDAMGGDHAPKSEVTGAIQAIKLLGVKVILVGRREVVEAELQSHPSGWDESLLEVHHASELTSVSGCPCSEDYRILEINGCDGY